MVNLLCSLSQDRMRSAILPLTERVDPIPLTALRTVQSSWKKILGIMAAPM